MHLQGNLTNLRPLNNVFYILKVAFFELVLSAREVLDFKNALFSFHSINKPICCL